MSSPAVPELPEVETIARELDARLAGRVVLDTVVLRSDVLRDTTANELAAILKGRAIVRVWRRAKSAIVSFDGGWHILIQPRFTGAVIVEDGAAGDESPLPSPHRSFGAPRGHDIGATRESDDPYATVVWTLDRGSFRYRDVRRLGTVTLANEAGLAAYDARIGAEPLDPAFDASRLSGLLRGSRSAIKKVLMDQRVLAGVGNIYANEALWRAGIDPSREARSVRTGEVERLHEALTSILAASISARGTTFRDYRDPSNREGSFATQLLAYGRGGAPCATCGTTLTETHAIDGRSTVFCHRCQR